MTRFRSAGWYLFEKSTPEKIGNIAANFSFTMMGFLVAALMVLTLQGESRIARRYRSSIYTRVLIVHVGITLAELAFVFTWALGFMLTPVTIGDVKWISLGCIAGLGMTLLTCVVVLAVQYRATRAHS